MKAGIRYDETYTEDELNELGLVYKGEYSENSPVYQANGKEYVFKLLDDGRLGLLFEQE
jgi:hypothetical protein